MKKFLSVFLAAALVLFGIMPERMLYAVESAAITVTSASGKRGETVDVPVVVSGNPGVAALSFDVKYDADRLELLKATDQKLLGSSTATFGNDLSANPYRLCWDDLSDSNNEENGTIVTLTFEVKENAPVGDADVEIILNENSTFDIDMNNVPFDMVGGTITVDSDGDAAITVTSASGKRGETVDVPVVVSGNPGVAALSFDVKYDADRLELLKATDQKLLGSSTATFGNDLSANPYRLCWDDLSDSNNEENGTIVTLTFKVKENAPVGDADIEIILNENSTFDIDMNNVPFDMVGGTITVDSDGDAAITVMSTSCKRGETVDVPVVVSGNPGVAALSFDVKYDADRLELLKATDQKLLGSSTATFGNDLSANPYRLCWDDLSDSNNEENGTIVDLTFKVKDNAPVGDADIEIILNENSTFDIDMNNVPFSMIGGTITVDSDGNVEPATEAPTTEPMTEPQTTEPATEAPTTEPESEPQTTEPATEAPTTEPETEAPEVPVDVLRYENYGDYIEITGCDESAVSVVIPAEIDGVPVTSIVFAAFAGCSELTSINVSENNTAFADIDGVLFNKEKTELLSYPNGKSETYTIPDSVTSIGDYAFYGTGLTEVTIPDSVTSISDGAFAFTPLTSITLPDSVTSIGWSAFGYTALESITILNPNCEIYDDEDTISNGLDKDFNGTIYGYENSTAQEYAEKYNRTFVSLGKAPDESSDEIMLGDVNNSGEIDAVDASLVLADYAAIQTGKKGKFTDAQRKAADVNGDGAADAIDASRILAYYAYVQTGHKSTFEDFLANKK